MSPDADTAARSLAHWSEAGRREMEAFYAFARRDYVELAAALDWGAQLAVVAGERDSLTLLDVACGSGKFPEALLRDCDLSALASVRAEYDLLDPSAFSLDEAARVLAPPFAERDRYETTLEDLDPAAGPWDVVWATHALYAMDPDKLAAGAERFVAAIAPGGFGFVGQGSREGHYLRVYEAYREHHDATPYTSVEDVADALRAAGANVESRRLEYEHVVEADDTVTLEGYLQRCLFDDSMSLDAMFADPALGPYLQSCREESSGRWRFIHRVDCLVVSGEHRAGGETPWKAAS